MSASKVLKAAGVPGGVRYASQVLSVTRPTLMAWYTTRPALFEACVDYTVKKQGEQQNVES